MKNAIETLGDRVDELESSLRQAEADAGSAKARAIILQEAMELLVRHA
jgi:hypothetical protein